MNSSQIQALCDQIIALYQAGRLAEAEQLCFQVRAADPRNFIALYIQGVIQFVRGDRAAARATIEAAMAAHPGAPQPLIYHGLLLEAEGRDDLALAAYTRALSLQPDMVEALVHRGSVLHRMGRFGDAVADFDLALKYRPDFIPALFGRGATLESLGKPLEALASYDRALMLQPDHPGIMSNRGGVLRALKRPAEALTAFDRLLSRDPGNVQAHYNRGVVLLDLGRPQEALTSFERTTSLAPHLADGWNNRGIVLRDLGRLGEALACCDKAVSLQSENAFVWNNRGVVLRALKRPQEALASYDKAIALQPNYPEAWNNRGVALRDLARLDEALASCDKAISLQPDYAYAWNNRGVALRDMKRPDEAMAGYDKAIALQPDYADAWNNRGVLLRDLKRLGEALADLDKAIALQPGHGDAWNNRGAVLRDLNRPDDALVSVDKAVALAPASADVWNNRGATLLGLRRPDDALASIDKAISLQPGYADAWNNRGVALRDMKRLDEGLAAFDKAVALKPDHADAWANRGAALWDLKRPDEAAASFGKALALNPDYEYLPGNYLHGKMKLCDWDGLDNSLAQCRTGIEAGKKIIVPFPLLGLVDDPALHKIAAQTYAKDKHPGRSVLGAMPARPAGGKIRIGYYSADFHHHATSFLIAEFLEARDAEKFEIYGYSFGPDEKDATRQRICAAFDKFLDVRNMTDRDVARLSREHGIDIAVDLKGYTQDARPGIFAEGCAPIQLQYLGYPGTMGADYFDYAVGDRIVLPPGSEKDYPEKIIRLPHSYQANDSKRKISERVFTRQEAGLPKAAFVFCCFNNNYKILPETFASWMRILKATPGSVLWLLEDNHTASENLRKQALGHGVDAARLVFAGYLPLDEHLARQRLADLSLDTLPYNAHTTASDALWAGLPVLTCMGKAFAGRVGASLLHAVGLSGLITESREDYETLGIALASQPDKLAGFRKTLAENRITAPLFDGKLTARHMEAAYQAIHARRLAGLAPDHVEVPA